MKGVMQNVFKQNSDGVGRMSSRNALKNGRVGAEENYITGWEDEIGLMKLNEVKDEVGRRVPELARQAL